jgi:predicted membrane channel-forming protein YqfA (hemolysin III family)
MNGRRYLVELSATVGAYAALLALSLTLLTHHAAPASWAAPVALAPMLPGAAICWVIIRQLRRIDEMQRRIQFEAIAIAFAATAITTFSYGFLENIGYPKLSMFAVWPLMGIFWVAGLFACRARYE